MVREQAQPEEIRVVEPLCAVFRRRLKGEGLKYTPERAKVLDTILRFEGTFEADMVLDGVRSSGIRVSKATVYRTIKLLHDAGIIQRILSNDDHARYQLAFGPRPSDQIVRVDTGDIESIDLPELALLVERACRARGLTPQGHRLQIFAVGS